MKPLSKPESKPLTVEDYLGVFPENVRMTLNKIRKAIRAAAPKAEEVVSYGVPSFKYDGMLVGFGAAKNHCALYVMSAEVMNRFKPALEGYDTSKATIRFAYTDSIPTELISKIVKERLKENELVALKRKQKPKKS